ncbi:hypothetical protein ACFQZJ_13545 [Maribacter chungangensis]|uniref:ATPase AAA-type core domain-containing protein n=1 Tax=Maribacter chungangensis TaxID=1069117 RepID=A0ABW3B578_9FLAO
MSLEYLKTKPSTNYGLPIVSNDIFLPLAQMLWEDFEKLCLRMVEFVERFDRGDCEIYGRKGQKQDGIDIYALKDNGKYYSFQCKKYKSISPTDLNDIFSEFQNGDWYSKSEKFFICTSANFDDIHLQKRFEELKKVHNKNGIRVEKWDFTAINRILKTHPKIVYDFFGPEWCKRFCGEEVFLNAINPLDFDKLQRSFTKASNFLSGVKNFFERKPESHIARNETKQIVDWVSGDLKNGQKNLLVLEGDKGMGKSVILKDVYEQLVAENYIVLGIKADKYYATNPKELESKIFLDDDIKFSRIIGALNTYKRQLIVIIDQLDALSQTLSSNREYIQTYNRIVNELIDEKNIRIIISSRSFDLKYDAELSIYKSNKYANIKTSLLTEKDVTSTLQKFGVNCSVKKVLKLLQTPNQLEVFCKLPNKKKISLDTLSSLKDLYDALWGSLIAPKSNLKLGELLFKMAIGMYDSQQIVISSKFSDKYYQEVQYLLSNQLIIEQESSFQFFHQTFYDYCFSRQFVEKGKDIFKYLNENEQNLEVRSVIKMVLEYLREYDHKRYNLSINSILKSSKYRFHIKSLVISNLGIIANPSSQEKEIFHKKILRNRLFEDVFIHSIVSKEWTEYLIKQKVFDKFLFNKETLANKAHRVYQKQSVFRFDFIEKYNLKTSIDYQRNLIWRFLRNNINLTPLIIMEYLDEFEDFTDKQNFNERVLMGLDDWQDERLLPYFEKYIKFNEESKGRDNFWYYEFLAKIFKHNDDYVFGLVKPIFKSVFNFGDSWHHNEFSHEQEELLKKMYDNSPEKTFKFTLDIYKSVINENKDNSNFEEVDSPFYKCTKFIDGFSSSKDAHIVLEEFFVKHLKSQINNREYIVDFFNEFKNTNSVILLRLVSLVLKEEKPRYVDEIYELISIVNDKNGFNSYDDKSQLYLRQMIGSSFSFFTAERKRVISKILLSIKSPYDFKFGRYKDSDEKEIISFYGQDKKQFLFIKQLPKREIWSIPHLKKVYQEFYRKFGDIESDKALHTSSSSGSYAVGAPLSQSAYNNMDFKNWKNSLTKFDDDYQEGHGPRGGKLEHSRAFGDSVRGNPGKYYGFVLSLFDEENVSLDYLSKGIDGLIQAKYEPEKVKFLHQKFIKLDLDRINLMYAIWHVEYLLKNGLVDTELVEFLSNHALNHPNPSEPMNENDPSFDSLNTIRGAAIHKLMLCYEHKSSEEIIFNTVEKAINDPQASVRVAIMQELGYLNYLDLNRSFRIFMKLINKNDVKVLKNSFRTSQYFNVKFHLEMLPYFNMIIENEDLHKDGNVIILSWLNDKISDKKLYSDFIKSSDEAKLCALRIAEANLFNSNETTAERAFGILYQFLGKKGEDFATMYSSIVLRKFKPHNFRETYSFLVKYSKSKLCMAQPSYFLQLLLTCVKDNPIKCLELIKNLKYNRVPNVQRRGYYDKEPIQLILAIYSKLNMDLSKNRKHIKRSLDIFDDMLKHNHLRNTLNEALDLIT